MKGVLYLYVQEHIYEFLTSEYNSPDGIIEIGHQDKFFEDIKFILQLNPRKVPPVNKDQYPRRITLLIPLFKIDKNTRINVLYRNYLPPNMQNLVRRHFVRLFKLRAHSFILGCCRMGSKQSDAIRDFFTVFNINENAINYEMVKKSWDRSSEKFLYFKNHQNIA
jgi:hypothetical protein